MNNSRETILKLRTSLHLVLITTLAVAMFSYHFFGSFEGLLTSDAHNIAQAARNIAEGEGYTTDVIYPLSWSMFPHVENHPEFQFPPLYPHLVASGFVFVGPKSYVPVLVSGVAYFVFAVLSYFIVRRLFGARSAFHGIILMVSYHYFVLFSLTGRTESLYFLLVSASLLVTLWESDNPYLLGILSALAYLTRFNHWFLLAGLLTFAVYKSNRSQHRYFFQFLSTFLLILTPYMIRNILLVGSPFYHHQVYELVADTPYFPDFKINMVFAPPNQWWFALTHPVALWWKWIENLSISYRAIPELFSKGWPVLILAATSFGQKKAESWNLNVKGTLFIFCLGFLLQGLLLSFVRGRVRYFVPFLPIVFYFAGQRITTIIKSRSGKYIGYLVLIIVLGLNIYFSLGMNVEGPREHQQLSRVSGHVPEGEPILTNIPQALAWATNRSSLALVPLSEANKHYGTINYILISSRPEALTSRKDAKRFLRSQTFRNNFVVLNTFPETNFRLFRRKVDSREP